MFLLKIVPTVPNRCLRGDQVQVTTGIQQGFWKIIKNSKARTSFTHVLCTFVMDLFSLMNR